MNDKTKKGLKIFGICYGIYCLLILILALYFKIDDPAMNALDFFIFLLIGAIAPLAHLFFPIVGFAPAIILLYFLFKKIKLTWARILLTAFLIPFLNLIYFIIEHSIVGGPGIFSMGLGGYTLFIILPLLFIVSCCLPKRILPFKKEVLATIPLMAIFGLVLIFCSNRINNYIDDKRDPYLLKQYEPLIESIEEYKVKNGVYPKKVEDTVKKYSSFYYYTRNNDKDFVLNVSNYYTRGFNYCSNKELDQCHPHKEHYAEYEQFGKWIKVIEYD